MEAAVRAAFEIAARQRDEAAAVDEAGPDRPLATVLLSPAAASFDMFVDYEARGAAFKAAVRTLEAARPPRSAAER
jgi:UDP-N-acetylmuramoylalanine-D-glutamate ligase